MKKLASLTIFFGFTMLAAASGYGEETPQIIVASPQQVEEVPQQIELSLADAVKMAVRRNIDLRTEALNASMAETDVAGSRGIYNPVFTATATGGITSVPGDPFFDTKSALASLGLAQNLSTGGNVSIATQTGFTTFDNDIPGTVSDDWQSAVGITVTQPLLKNGGKKTTELNITLAANTLQSSLERFRWANTDTVLAVLTAYNHLYTLRQVTESRVAALNSAQQLLDEITKRAKPTSLQAMESANAEYAVAQRQKELVEAERNARDQEASLRYLIGMESKIQLIPVDPPSLEEPPETEEEAVKMALEHRSELKEFRLALKASQLQEEVARHQKLPDLTISGGAGLNGTADTFDRSVREISNNPGTWWSAGAQFIAPLGNAVAKNDYLKSRFRTEQAKNQIQAVEWRIRNEVEEDLRALISARLQMQVADKALPIATLRREEYLKQSRAGVSTIQDVINAENDLASARNARTEAVETFANAVAKLWRDIGVLLDRQGVHIDISKPDNLMGARR